MRANIAIGSCFAVLAITIASRVPQRFMMHSLQPSVNLDNDVRGEETQNAVATYNEVVTDVSMDANEAVRRMSNVLFLKPDFVYGHYVLYMLSRFAGDSDSAYRHLNTALSYFSDNTILIYYTDGVVLEKTTLLYNKALLTYQNAHKEEADELLDEVIRILETDLGDVPRSHEDVMHGNVAHFSIAHPPGVEVLLRAKVDEARRAQTMNGVQCKSYMPVLSRREGGEAFTAHVSIISYRLCPPEMVSSLDVTMAPEKRRDDGFGSVHFGQRRLATTDMLNIMNEAAAQEQFILPYQVDLPRTTEKRRCCVIA